jgi:Domain of unknown function (DUF4331)
MFAGVRSDPFFADAEGALHGFHWTGEDTFANKDVLTIALEVPDEMLGTDAKIGAWATTSLWRDDLYGDRFAWLTHGRVGPDGLQPHSDLQAQFPYLGVPNA